MSGHDKINKSKDIPNPSDWMRARHPDLYSDSWVDEGPRLPKPVFEYFLETLTSRKQEYEFEHFCRKLAEKEICPNLRVQTGPTGGGDSKVDSETYPVAEEISERWWIGLPSAGAERWGFAFSAKKAWKPKLKADVENILSTGRNYEHIYFFTNQFVSDRERSTQEDALSKHAQTPVHIVDRAWIVEKVYEGGHLELAIAALGIEGASNEKASRTGPRDVTRLMELEELDRQVADSSRYEGARYQLVEDCLRSAILARGLERPRGEVESRFALADRLAQKLDYNQQRLRISYNRAWTAFWWYEDYSTFNLFFIEVEQRVQGSVQASEVELLCNLWQLLIPAVAAGRMNPADADIESRRQRLVAMLEAIAADSARPNNALQARTSLVLMRITQEHQDADQLESVWRDLSQIVDDSTSLAAYPLERLSDIVTELGDHIDTPIFDSLYEKLVDEIRRRRSDGDAGEAYVERGFQKIKQGKPYEAIQWLGRAEELLIKNEYRINLITALVASSYAYERVGLLWAARNKALAAVERCLAVFNEHGEMIRPTLPALQRLVWVELQLGRIPHVLNGMNLADFVASHLKLSEDRQKAYSEERQTQEAVLGIHFLNLPYSELPSLATLPDVLDRLGLITARTALLYSLGHEQVLRQEGCIPLDEDPSAVSTFFELWQDQPAAKDIPAQPMLMHAATSFLKSIILGLELVVETPNNLTSFGIAESFLGALEAFLSTSNDRDVVPHRERIIVVVRESALISGSPVLSFLGDSENPEILHPEQMEFKTGAERREYCIWLKDCLAQFIPRMLMIRDIDEWGKRLTTEENAFSRSLLLGDAMTLNHNVFGASPQFLLKDFAKPGDQVWDVLREKPWRVPKAESPSETTEPSEPPKFGKGPLPEGLIDNAEIKHTERRILSPINTQLWDQAKWQATLFGWHPQAPPLLALGFKNSQAGEAIFRAWQEQWGSDDTEDVLRVTIVIGLSTANPAKYAVIIGPNLQHAKNRGAKRMVIISRINRMNPESTANLNSFISAYQRAGVFLFTPADLSTGTPTPLMQSAISKHHLHIREAWQISENDPDASALDVEDEPIIPDGVVDPPVNAALAQIRAFRQATDGSQ